MIISVINRTHHVKDEKILMAFRAINRQIIEDFQPYWSFGATLRLEGTTQEVPEPHCHPEYVNFQPSLNTKRTGVPYRFSYSQSRSK